MQDTKGDEPPIIRPTGDGWRIAAIPFGHSRPASWNWTDCVGLVGLVAFLGGCAAMIFTASDSASGPPRLLVPTVLGFLLMMFVAWWRARAQRRNWRQVIARCLDRECRRVLFRDPEGDSSYTWEERILCEFEFAGHPYRVTPRTHYSTFASEKAAHRFLNQRIAADQTCRLWVNPDNPLETELVGQGIKDWLLH